MTTQTTPTLYHIKGTNQTATDRREQLTDTEYAIRQAAISTAYGETVAYYPEPGSLTPREESYLLAIELFLAGKQVRGWEAIEAGDQGTEYQL